MIIRPAAVADRETLLDIWLRLVEATHAFLTSEDIPAMTLADYMAVGDLASGTRVQR